MYSAFLPFCSQTPVPPQHRFLTLPLSLLDFLLAEGLGFAIDTQARR
jgi:hypothetical protein